MGIALIYTTFVTTGCTQQDNAQLSKAQAVAEAAKAEAEIAKSGLEKARADTLSAQLEAKAAKAELAKMLAKPAVSEESKTRIIAMLEKGSKLRATTESSLTLSTFKNQLADVKSGYETVTLVGWPTGWQAEQGLFEAAIDGWSLGQHIWETQLGLAGLDRFSFSINAYAMYGDKLKALSVVVDKRTGDKDISKKFESSLRLSGTDTTIMADKAIQWCFTAATKAFDKSREGLRIKIKQ